MGYSKAAGAFLAVVTAWALPGLREGLGQGANDPGLDLYYNANALCSRRQYKLAVDEYKAFLSKYPSHAKVPKAQWGLAIGLYNLGRLKEAEPLLAKIAGHAEIAAQDQLHNLWGSCLLEMQRWADAQKAFAWTIANAKDPAARGVTDARIGLVESLSAQGKWAEVIAAGEAMLKHAGSTPQAADVRYRCGVARAKLSKHAEAIAVFAKIVETSKDPQLVHCALFQQAECLQAAGKAAEAAGLYAKAAKTTKGPFSEFAHYNLGVVQFAQKQYGEAIKELSAFPKAWPASKLVPEAQLYLGRAYLEAKDHNKAASILKQLSTREPVAAAATLWYARTYSRRGQYSQVVELLTPAVRKFAKDPLLPGMLHELATAQMNSGQPEQAAKTYATGLSVGGEGQRAEFLRLQAFCLHRAGQYDASVKICQDFLGKYGDDEKAPDVLFMQAENLMLADKGEQAAPLLSKFLTAWPDHERGNLARFRRAQTHISQKRWAPAGEDLAAVLAGDHKADVFEQAPFMAGECHLHLERWDKAVAAFEAFIEQKPDALNVDTAMFNLSLAYQRKDQPDKAVAILTRLIDEYYGAQDKRDKRDTRRKPSKSPRPTPHLQRARLELGRLLFEAERFEQAKSRLTAALKEYAAARQRGDGRAEYYLGWIALREGDSKEAAKQFAALRSFPSHPFAADAALQAAILQIREGKSGEAQAVLQKTLKDNPKHPKADQLTYYVGLCYARRKQHREAVGYFEKVLKGYPDSDKADNAMYWQGRCRETLSKNGPAEAVKTYEALLKRFPKSEMRPDALVALAELQFQAGENDAVIERLTPLLSDAAKKEPLSPPLKRQALYLLGWSNFKREKLDAAAKAFEAMVAVNRAADLMQASAYFQAGEARRRLKEYDRAREHFGKAVAIGPGPTHEPALLRRAECEALAEEWRDSEKSCTEFQRLYSKSKLMPRVYYQLGWALQNQKQYTQAIIEYRKVVSAGEKTEIAARCQFQLGECLLHLGKLDEAVKELTRVESAYGLTEQSSKAMLEIGRILEMQNQPRQAIAQYNEVIRRFPESSAAAVAKNLLQKLQ